MKTTANLILCVLLFCALAFGQGTAQLHGTVRDASGAAVPGAEVKVTQTDTGISRTVSSEADGGYVVPSLAIGPYQVEVTKEGFSKAVQTGVVLQVNSDPLIDVSLKVGAVVDTVNVEANAAQVETRSSGIGEVVQTQRIVELPLNGRNVTDLIALAGTSVQTGTNRASWGVNLPQINVAGGVYYGTEYTLDGANHVSYLAGTTMPVAFPEAVQEFKVESSGQTSQRGASTSVSMVTRSGTNELHGNLFEYIRNDGLGSAHEYFSTTKSTLKRNQFGGIVGGPVKKNKLFFFGGFQGTILRVNPGNSTATVPTAQALAGDWSTMASAACNNGVARTLTGAPAGPFANNQVSPALYATPALYFMNKILPNLGTTPDPCGRITYNTPSVENDYQYVGKVDFQINDKQSLFFRLLDTKINSPSTDDRTTNLLASTGGFNQLTQSYAIGHTYVVTSNIVQSVRLAMNRNFYLQGGNPHFSYADAGVQIWNGEDPHTMSVTALTISGGFGNPGGTRQGDHWASTSFNLNDDVGWVKGSHQFTFGAGALMGIFAEINHFASGGQFTFTGQRTGLGLTDFMLGTPTQFFQGLPNSAATRQNFINVYFTDSWRITPRLTFNYGVRWEPFLPQTISNGHISTFDFGRFNAIVAGNNSLRSTQFINAPAGFYFPGDPGFPDKTGMYKQWSHFDPRGGLAWDPKGDGKTSLRAGYAFGYTYVPGVTREDQGGTNPWGGRSTYANPGVVPPAAGVVGFVNPWVTINNGVSPFPYDVTPGVKFTPGGQFITQAYDLPTANTYSWNVALQRQITPTWIASATYIGSRVMHLYINTPINAAQIVPGPIVASGCLPAATNCNAAANIQARRPISLASPADGQIVSLLIRWDPSGTQTYHGLLMSLQHRFSNNYSMSANWTHAHCIGYFQGFNSKPDQTSTVPNNPLFDRGNCDADRRNIVNITAVALSPKFSNKTARWVASDWQLAGIYRFTSGMPLSIQNGTDRELSGINHQRPNLLQPDSVYTGQSGPSAQYFNPAAFALVTCSATVTTNCQPLGSIGNLGWNSVVGPTYWDIDLAVSRQFRITERQRIEFRADAFNITNSFVSVTPTTANPVSAAVPSFASISSNQFGQNLTAAATRKMQFALKYIF